MVSWSAGRLDRQRRAAGEASSAHEPDGRISCRPGDDALPADGRYMWVPSIGRACDPTKLPIVQELASDRSGAGKRDDYFSHSRHAALVRCVAGGCGKTVWSEKGAEIGAGFGTRPTLQIRRPIHGCNALAWRRSKHGLRTCLVIFRHDELAMQARTEQHMASALPWADDRLPSSFISIETSLAPDGRLEGAWSRARGGGLSIR
ncbi:hypothetical protein RJ55_04361 [Drechmeria coniospora]|nr:hypothetical protein RJ55_04361 [Drechmeria coniospora]